MKIAMLAWESMHSVAAGGVAAHVSVFTRRATGQPFYSRINGVHYYRCSYSGHSDFVEDVNDMCRSIVDHVFEVEDRFGPFDVVHAHDWLVANAMIWIKQGRQRLGVMTIHSTEYGRCGNHFYDGQSERIRSQERAGIQWADRVIAVSRATALECKWMYETIARRTEQVYDLNTAGQFQVSEEEPTTTYVDDELNDAVLHESPTPSVRHRGLESCTLRMTKSAYPIGKLIAAAGGLCKSKLCGAQR